jgi:hypothetical protein
MIFALNRSVAITFAVTIMLGLVSGIAAAGLLGAPAQIWGARGAVILILNLLLIVLNFRPLLRFIHIITFARHWWFPWLDGTWDAEIRSNWPTIERTLDAARSSRRFDPLSHAAAPDAPGALTRATVTIRTTLLAMTIRLVPEGTQRVSKSRFVRPRWVKPGEPELTYIYEQIDDGAIAVTDARRHFGAARLVYDADTDTLRGEYWTERRGETGINTAGMIVLKRRA